MDPSVASSPSFWLGVWLRLLGLVLAWACGSLGVQVRMLAGSRGIQPAQERLRAIHRDFEPPWRILRFPSIMHAITNVTPKRFDRLLPLPLFFAAACGLLVAAGVWSRLCLAAAWAVYLSYATVVHLVIYPWDYLLLEATFLSLFLPAALPLWTPLEGVQLGLSATPAPLVTLSLRWLLFRLMFGFGKMKFLGASTKVRQQQTNECWKGRACCSLFSLASRSLLSCFLVCCRSFLT